MRNFLKIATGVNVTPLMLAIHRQPDLWNRNTLRTTHPSSPHTQVEDIWLRFNEMPAAGREAEILDEHESVEYPSYSALPEARALVMSVFAAVAGERLGRVLITRLPPGGHIEPHVDGGSHAAYYDRMHVVLQAAPGSQFRCGEESVEMATGDVYWFQNSIEHEVWNRSVLDRVHLIIDAKCSS